MSEKDLILKSSYPVTKDTMHAYNPLITPTRGVGIIPESFRKFSGVVLSNHPEFSFAAFGKYSEDIIKNHSLNFGLGENSPLSKIYDLDGWVLFIRVDYETNTSFHLSEYRSNIRNTLTHEAAIFENNKKI